MSTRASVSIMALLAGLVLGLTPPAPASASLPSGFSDTPVASVSKPTALAFTPDGRLLITTQPGLLRIVSGGSLLSRSALDLTSRICDSAERGLLAVAVDPSFGSNHFIYLYYTAKKSGDCFNRVSRFTLGGNTAASELVLVDNIPSPAGNHNGGDLHFGADGLLYIGVGDGGCSLSGSGCQGDNDNARSLSILSGKILRVNKADGTAPSSNPRAGDPDARRCGDPAGPPPGNGPCKEMFAWGLRNPFRFAFKPGTNEFYINDVGGRLREEIDVGQKDADYGWNCREGAHSTDKCSSPPPNTVDPIYEYGHGTGCFTITGGVFVPSGVWPASYDGAYLFADFGCGKIFKLTSTGGVTVDFDNPFASGLGTYSIVAMVFGPFGTGQSLYYATYANGGQVRRIDFAGSTAVGPVDDLIATVKGFQLPRKVEKSLQAKLQAARRALAAKRPNIAAACTQLAAFIERAQAQSGKALSSSQANQVIDQANQIRSTLACT